MHSHFLRGLISLFVLAAGFQTANLQESEALLFTDPIRLEIGSGQVAILKIRLENAEKIYGIDLQATFDPAVVEVVDADSVQTGVQMLPGAFLEPDFVARNLVDNTTGTLRYVITQLKPTPAATGSGIVLRIHFLGKTQGASSQLTFTSAVIADRRGNKQAVATRGADLVIVAPSPPTPTPHPTHTPHPTRTIKPTLPTLPSASLTPARVQPTSQSGPTVSRIIAAVPPNATAAYDQSPAQSVEAFAGIDPARVPGMDPVVSDRLLIYITVGGFSGAVLLLVLTAAMLAAQRCKERNAKSK